MVAANGSGKDKYIVAPFCLWFLLSKLNSRVIVTSASAQQLDSQTENYIRRLAQHFNKEHGEEIIRVVKRYISCPLTGSEIRLFATDEAGKAEGYHPLEPGAEMAIVCGEAKSIAEDIYEALGTCSGFNYWIDISTPGVPLGTFYRMATEGAKHGVDFKRVTSYDCAHISRETIEFDKFRYGENSPRFRSKHLALFTSLDGAYILTREIIDKYIGNVSERRDGIKRAGLDFGAGGDETVLSVWDGNTQIASDGYTNEDTEATVRWVIQKIKEYSLDPGRIFADDGGVGRGMIFSLRDKGYDVNRCLAQSPAIDKRDFLNRGAELWWSFARCYEAGMLKILPNKVLIEQLSTRKYKQPSGGKIRLISKKEMKAEGLPSPDHADAAILAHTGRGLESYMELPRDNGKVTVSAMSTKDIEAELERRRYGGGRSDLVVKAITNPALLVRRLHER
jgi:hypothetical protein